MGPSAELTVHSGGVVAMPRKGEVRLRWLLGEFDRIGRVFDGERTGLGIWVLLVWLVMDGRKRWTVSELVSEFPRQLLGGYRCKTDTREHRRAEKENKRHQLKLRLKTLIKGGLLIGEDLSGRGGGSVSMTAKGERFVGLGPVLEGANNETASGQ